MWWALGVQSKISYRWSLPWRSSAPSGGHINLIPSLLTLIEHLLETSSELSPAPVIVSELSPGRCYYHTLFTGKTAKAQEKVHCPRAHHQESTGWDRASSLFDFVRRLCLSLQPWIAEIWRMHAQESLQGTLRVQGRMYLILSREAREGFLRNIRSREEENVGFGWVTVSSAFLLKYIPHLATSEIGRKWKPTGRHS